MLDQSPTSPKKPASLAALAGFLSPTVFGVLLIIAVVSGACNAHLLDSQIESAVALVVGAVLILGGMVLYIRGPDEYIRHRKSDAEQLLALLDELPGLIERGRALAAIRVASVSPPDAPAIPAEGGDERGNAASNTP
jgi:hypothetical protein